jgi:hypothetical protein
MSDTTLHPGIDAITGRIRSIKPVPALRTELYEGIRDGRLKHYQGTWFMHALWGESVEANRDHCGTTACAAGWTALLAAPADAVVRNAGIMLDGVSEDADDYAERALGLNTSGAWALFYRSTDEQALAQLKFYAENPDAMELPASVHARIFRETVTG